MPARMSGFDAVHAGVMALDLRLSGHGLDTALRLAALAEPMRDLMRLMRSEPLHGRLPEKALQVWIDRTVAALPAEDAGGRLTGDAMDAVRGNPILSALFGRMRDDLGRIDVHGLDADSLAEAAHRLMRAPEALAREVADASPFMAARLKGHMAEMTEAGREALRDEAPWSKGHDAFLDASQRYAFELTAWTAAYSKAIEAGIADPVVKADAMVPARTEPGASIGHLLPSFAAYSAKSGNAHLAGQPANAQSLYWLGMLSPVLFAARLPDTGNLRPWLPTASHTTLPPLPILQTSAKSAKAPEPPSLKDIHDPATLASALTGIAETAAAPSLENSTSSVSYAQLLMQPEQPRETAATDFEAIAQTAIGTQQSGNELTYPPAQYLNPYNISTGGMNETERSAVIEYAQRSNVWLTQNGGTTVKATAGTLRSRSNAATRIERLNAARAGKPYQGQAGHVPDTALTGLATPPAGWLDMPGRSNSIVGGGLSSRIGQKVDVITVDGEEP